MIPQLGPNPFAGQLQPTAPQTNQADPGRAAGKTAAPEAAASRLRPEIAERVDPAKQGEGILRLPPEFRRIRPDLDAPAGPPPAFEANLLEQDRAKPIYDAIGPAEAPRDTEASDPQADPPQADSAPPGPSQLARDGIALTQRLAQPAPQGTVDLTL